MNSLLGKRVRTSSISKQMKLRNRPPLLTHLVGSSPLIFRGFPWIKAGLFYVIWLSLRKTATVDVFMLFQRRRLDEKEEPPLGISKRDLQRAYHWPSSISNWLPITMQQKKGELQKSVDSRPKKKWRSRWSSLVWISLPPWAEWMGCSNVCHSNSSNFFIGIDWVKLMRRRVSYLVFDRGGLKGLWESLMISSESWKIWKRTANENNWPILTIISSIPKTAEWPATSIKDSFPNNKPLIVTSSYPIK